MLWNVNIMDIAAARIFLVQWQVRKDLPNALKPQSDLAIRLIFLVYYLLQSGGTTYNKYLHRIFSFLFYTVVYYDITISVFKSILWGFFVKSFYVLTSKSKCQTKLYYVVEISSSCHIFWFDRFSPCGYRLTRILYRYSSLRKILPAAAFFFSFSPSQNCWHFKVYLDFDLTNNFFVGLFAIVLVDEAV